MHSLEKTLCLLAFTSGALLRALGLLLGGLLALCLIVPILYCVYGKEEVL